MSVLSPKHCHPCLSDGNCSETPYWEAFRAHNWCLNWVRDWRRNNLLIPGEDGSPVPSIFSRFSASLKLKLIYAAHQQGQQGPLNKRLLREKDHWLGFFFFFFQLILIVSVLERTLSSCFWFVCFVLSFKLISLFSWFKWDLLFHLPCQWEFSFTDGNFIVPERSWGSAFFLPPRPPHSSTGESLLFRF